MSILTYQLASPKIVSRRLSAHDRGGGKISHIFLPIVAVSFEGGFDAIGSVPGALMVTSSQVALEASVE